MLNLLLYSAAVLIWGCTWLVIKFQLTQVPPVPSVAYRFGLAATILFAFCFVTNRSLRYSARQHGYLALYGGLIFVVGTSSAIRPVFFSPAVCWRLSFRSSRQ